MENREPVDICIENLSKEEIKLVIHDLKVQQIELEMQNEELKRIHEELDITKARYYDIFEMAPEGYLILTESGMIIESNHTAAELLGCSGENLKNRRITQFIYKEDQKDFYTNRKHLVETFAPQTCELRMLKSDGSIFWAKLKATVNIEETPHTCRMIISDISQRKKTEAALEESELKYKALFKNMEQGFALHEFITGSDGKIRDVYTDINDSYERMFGVTRESCIGRSVRDLLPNVEQKLIDILGTVAASKEAMNYEGVIEPNGRHYSIFFYSPQGNQVAVLITDIEDRVKKDERIRYLSYHDMLTGLFNRHFLDEEIKRLDTERNLPFSIIMGDVNRLKLVNDAFGHDKGDELLIKAADAIRQSCRVEDLAARWGGDEFMIFLTRTSCSDAQKIISRIRENCASKQVNSVGVSLSFGIATKESIREDLHHVLQEAEKDMYRTKAFDSERDRADIINALINALYEKNPYEERHAKHVSALCGKMAEALGYDSERADRLTTAGLIHDIGKVAVSSRILEKPAGLNEDEWREIRKHTETGARIVGPSQDMSEIGNAILAHHERADGKGYPSGIKWEDVSEPARIIALADSYDSMTGQSLYRKRMTEQEAVDEIRRNEGTQFDRQLAETFILRVLGKV
ncbi:MAG: diguanylate cyclase [Clostridiales bacterium]|nr:diguanylate cyclase [Clostridiales bacterium]